MQKVALHTLGCRLNMTETAQIAQGFAQRGYEIVELGESADVTFINTCTVTDGADATCRNLIRKARKASPSGKIVVAGCYAQMESKNIQKDAIADVVLGTAQKSKVFDYLDPQSTPEKSSDLKREALFENASTTKSDVHTRGFLKIQDGCNYQCSFCIIPFARGRSRTISVSDAVQSAKQLVQSGFRELVLTGVNIGEYEHTSGEKLWELISEIVEKARPERLRLSSVEPNTISEKLLEVLKATGIYQPHFHVPVQSGSDRMLQIMKRKYDSAFYRETLAMIQDFFPTASIGADMIAGHPGETTEFFEESFNFFQQVPLTHFHVFPFSSRKGTPSSQMEKVQQSEKKRRVQQLIALGDRKLKTFSERFHGLKRPVLFENRKGKYWSGYTPEFLRCYFESEENLNNKIRNVELSEQTLCRP